MDEKVQKVLDYIEEHKEEYLELLLRFCRQPSVAATGEGIEKMAGMVVDELKKDVYKRQTYAWLRATGIQFNPKQRKTTLIFKISIRKMKYFEMFAFAGSGKSGRQHNL